VEPPQTSRPTFQGQSSSLEPTQIDRQPMTSYLCSAVTRLRNDL